MLYEFMGAIKNLNFSKMILQRYDKSENGKVISFQEQYVFLLFG